MRKIKFRGKPTERFQWLISLYPDYFIDGFYYGYLVYSDNRFYICRWIISNSNSAPISNSVASSIEVIPETVGQYSGVGDLYEGDTISITNKLGCNMIGNVEYDGENLIFVFKNKNGECSPLSSVEHYEIIGNKYV